jgi:DNA invertase Pin-like site-specific DNA recombinase
MRAKAAELGWGEPVIYRDNDLSSKAGVDRPERNRMMPDLAAGIRDGLLVYKIDRYSREPSHLDALKDAGWWVASEYRTFDVTTSDGMKALRDEGNAAEYETKKMSERLLAQRQQAAEDGVRVGARAFGWGSYSKKGKIKNRNKVNKAEKALVLQGMERVLKSASLASICRDWNAQGFRTSRGSVWTTGGLRNVLERWSNAGVRQHQGQPLFNVETEWEALCDLETLEKVRAKLGAQENSTTSTRARKHLLSGVLQCECGSPMKAQHVKSSLHGKPAEYDQDGNKRPTHYKCVGLKCGRSVPYRDSDAAVVRWLTLLLIDLPPHAFLTPEVKAEIDKAHAELVKIDKRRYAIKAADIEEGDRLEMLTKVKKDRDAQRVVLASYASTSALNSLVASLDPYTSETFKSFTAGAERIKAVRSNFQALDLKQQKDLLQALAAFTVGTGFSEPDAKGNRRKLKAHERIKIELHPEYAHLPNPQFEETLA